MKPKIPALRRSLLDALEMRVLLSATGQTAQPLSYLPNETAVTAPSFSDLWHLQNTGQTLHTPIAGPATGTPNADIDAVRAWDLTTGTHDVIIAVLDTGIDWTHPDLAANLWANPGEIPNNGIDDDADGLPDDVYGWNFVDNNNDTRDSVGHGTTVAGVIGAVGNNGQGITGVSWNVSILPVKVGTITGVTNQALISGINYIIGLKQRGYDIVAINASYLDFSVPDLNVLNAIQSAGNNGLLYIAAAGNGGINLDAIDPIGYWGSQSNVITVAATNNQDQLASFSNYSARDVDLGAPGVDILSTGPAGSYLVVSGTSYAAPMVSGAVALLASYVPTASVAQIRNAILSSVDAVPSLAGKTKTGGRLNVYDALQTLIGNQAPFGALEQATGSVISGWAFDFNAGRQPLTATLYLDGQAYATTTAQEERPDLVAQVGSSNHGFIFQLDAATLGGGTHTASVYVNDYPASTQTLLGTKTFSVAPAAPFVSYNNVQIFLNQTNPIDFGSQLVGGTGGTRTFTVRNIGDLPLPLSALAAPAGFVINDNLTASLAPGASDSFTLQLATSDKGVKSGNVTFNYGSATFAFAVMGTVGDSFVQRLYRDILQREADPAGLGAWNGQILAGGMSPVQITSAFLNSTEYRMNRIQELYQNILGRSADNAGMAAWLGYFAAGGTVEQMAAGFYGSQEYYNTHGSTNASVVNAYYVSLLGRPGDPMGVNYWVSLIGAGYPRSEVSYTILKSQEGRERTMQGLYVRYLHRSADPAGLSYWSNQLLQPGQSETTVITTFLSSAEYFAQ